MCGRYSVLTENEIIEIREMIREISLRLLKDDFEEYTKETEEVYPTNLAPVIVGHGNGDISFERLMWGFQKYDGKGVIINARCESLSSKKMFSRLLAYGRCVVPAREYYEWKNTGRDKIKHYIKDKDGNILFMAGLYQDIPRGREFVIITKDAYESVRQIHDRAPVILRVDQIEQWLNGTLSPDDITQVEFNATVEPCEIRYEQMSLDETLLS